MKWIVEISMYSANCTERAGTRYCQSDQHEDHNQEYDEIQYNECCYEKCPLKSERSGKLDDEGNPLSQTKEDEG